MKIENFEIKEKVFIVAELSANHGQNILTAKKTIQAAKKAGADAIKLQTYTADTLTIDCANEYFRLNSGTIWDGRTLYDLYKEAYTPWEWHKELMEYADEIGLICFSTPFDFTSADFLEELHVPAYKIASFEIMDLPLIEHTAKKGKPMIISTGIGTLSDIEKAVNTCKKAGNDQIILLKCTSSYPSKIEDANLNTLINLRDTFGVEVGVSDHTIGNTVPIAAVALGACIIEKHFILDKSIGGPDASFSMDFEELKQMVNDIRETEKALGKVDYSITNEKKNSRMLGRSLFVVQDIKKGEMFTSENVRSIRPGFGISPEYIESIFQRKAKWDVKRGTPLTWDILN